MAGSGRSRRTACKFGIPRPRPISVKIQRCCERQCGEVDQGETQPLACWTRVRRRGGPIHAAGRKRQHASNRSWERPEGDHLVEDGVVASRGVAAWR